MSGRRDFGDFVARLEKHLEQLPDYAQRVAQEKLQRYVPQADERTNPLRRPPVRPPSITDMPAFAEVRAKWDRWNEPAARHARRKARTSRALTLWIVLVLLCGLGAVTGLLTVESTSTVAVGMAGVIVFGALGVRSGLRLRRLNRTQLPVSTVPAPLPPAGSAAHEPIRRLAECEESLAELLRQLSALSVAVPEMSVEAARTTAVEAAAALRGIAVRIQAVERARKAAPASERGALDSAVHTLREQLEDGLDGYGALVAAAGRAVAASGNGLQQSKEALTDATDRLAGLAIALRELS